MLCVHPKGEPLDKCFQGRRARYHAAYDALRRRGLAGPERLAREDAAARQQLAPVAPEPAVAAPPGARCCDALLFGREGRERARAAAQQRRRGGGSRAGLLVVGGGGPEDADGALREALTS